MTYVINHVILSSTEHYLYCLFYT